MSTSPVLYVHLAGVCPVGIGSSFRFCLLSSDLCFWHSDVFLGMVLLHGAVFLGMALLQTVVTYVTCITYSFWLDLRLGCPFGIGFPFNIVFLALA